MSEEFYNAFATSPTTPASIAQNMNLENETGTMQKPPKLMSIEEYYGWKDRFENWVQANDPRSWECILKKYVRPRTELRTEKAISDFSDKERDMYKAEKIMISLLQQAIKEDIFVLLQHDKTSKSIWDALKTKFEGSEKMIKSKKAMLKKEFDLFTCLPGEDTKKLIERYCHLVRSMSMLSITKEEEEWVDKLADALPQKEWGTFMMILKNTGEYDGLMISQFIEKIEGQDLEQQKIARISNPSGQQDVKCTIKAVFKRLKEVRRFKLRLLLEIRVKMLIKVQTTAVDFLHTQVSIQSSNTSFHSQNTKGGGCVIQCNIALNLLEGQSFSEEIAKDHMSLLATVLQSYEGLVAGRIGNPMLTKEDYDQIDAEEMELMDIKWCLASVLRRAEKFKMITGRNDFLDAHVSTLGFDKSKVTCFRCREKGHFKRECKNREASETKNPFGKDDYYRKAIYQQVGQQQQQEPQVAHGRKVIEDSSKRACLVNQENFSWDKYIPSDSKACLINQDDEKLPEGFSWDQFVDENGEFKAFIAKIVKEPDMFIEWMKAVGVNVSSEEEKSVSSDESLQSSDESSEREIVFDQTPSDSDRLEKLKERQTAKERKKMKSESVAQKDEAVQNDEVESVAEKIVETEKVTEDKKVVESEKIKEVEKIVEIIKPCSKCLESCKECAAKDEKLAEFQKMKEQLLFNLNYVKESYDVLNRTVTDLQKTNSEREDALTMMNATMMTKQKAINHYIEECAKLKQELETEKIENERIRLLLSYSSSNYLIDRIYPTVAGFEAFQDEKPKKKDTGKKPSVSYNKCSPPIWEGYSPRKPNEEQVQKAVNIKLKSDITNELPENINVTFTSFDTDHESELIKKVVDQVLDTDEESESKSESGGSSSSVNSPKSSVKRVYSKEFLLSKSNLNDETFEVAYTLNDSDKLYSDKEFPIRSVRFEMIKKVFKMTEINISEIKDLNLTGKPKKYTSRVQQRLNKKKGYNSGSGFQKKPNHNGNFKKKGLGFIPPENYKNDKISKTNTKFVSGGSAEEEQKKPFWKQSKQEFLAEKKRIGTGVFHRKDTRTCFKCNEVGHIA
ncbi:putative transcription factor interactor and regulator CCHC(Zn) family [Helianthus annuus]|nr:putative transcription factor interactor and regulator CCHC(Zn) family [Helianthus annuus]